VWHIHFAKIGSGALWEHAHITLHHITLHNCMGSMHSVLHSAFGVFLVSRFWFPVDMGFYLSFVFCLSRFDALRGTFLVTLLWLDRGYILLACVLSINGTRFRFSQFGSY
jgi:hypothetical protein